MESPIIATPGPAGIPASLYLQTDIGSFVEEDSAGVPLEATRHIFCGGNYLDPSRQDQLEHLKRGGEELLSNHCMRRTVNRFLPRCTIVPLELGGEVISVDLRPQEGDSVRPLLTYKGVDKQESAGRLFPDLKFYPFYPGEMIRDAISAGHENRGIVEITPLRGIEWATGEAQAVQDLIFPSNWDVPIRLALIEERINQAAEANRGTIKDICGEMLQACDLFRRYGMGVISRENSQVQQRVHPAGHVYSYSEKARSLATQLDVKLIPTVSESVNDQLLRALSDSANRPITPEMVQVIGIAVAEAVKQALSQGKPADEPPAEPKAVKAKPAKKVDE